MWQLTYKTIDYKYLLLIKKKKKYQKKKINANHTLLLTSNINTPTF